MPLVLFAYFAIEVLAFIGVAHFIGIGWAFFAVFALSALGGLAANVSLRNALSRTAGGRESLGNLAGDSAILMTGWVLCILPGFVSSVLGLLMIFPPTRSLMRRSLTARARASVERFGMRVYSSTPMAQRRTTYGSFTGAGDPQVIDADELEQWYRADSATDEDRPNRGDESGGKR